jgi:hypothetical protein
MASEGSDINSINDSSSSTVEDWSQSWYYLESLSEADYEEFDISGIAQKRKSDFKYAKQHSYDLKSFHLYETFIHFTAVFRSKQHG